MLWHEKQVFLDKFWFTKSIISLPHFPCCPSTQANFRNDIFPCQGKAGMLAFLWQRKICSLFSIYTSTFSYFRKHCSCKRGLNCVYKILCLVSLSFLFVCLSILYHASLCLSVYLSLCLPVCLFVVLSIICLWLLSVCSCVFDCLFVRLFYCLFSVSLYIVRQSLSLTVPTLSVSVRLSVFTFCLSFSLTFYLSFYMSFVCLRSSICFCLSVCTCLFACPPVQLVLILHSYPNTPFY